MIKHITTGKIDKINALNVDFGFVLIHSLNFLDSMKATTDSAIIPANVRYDKALPPNAKLLYGEITALCNERGYCWASNAYFAELYGVSKKSVSTWITTLAKRGYISVEVKYKEGTAEILGRYIRIVPEGIEKNFHTPMEEKVTDNNTVSNNTKNNTPINATNVIIFDLVTS